MNGEARPPTEAPLSCGPIRHKLEDAGTFCAGMDLKSGPEGDKDAAMMQEIGRAAAETEEDTIRDQGGRVRVTCRYFRAS